MLPSLIPAAVRTVTAAPSPTPSHSPPAAGHGGGGGLWLLLLLAGFIWLIAHLISVRLHPLRTCRACNGTGLHRGHLFTGAVRACRRCGGTRRELRPGARAPDRHH
ncbi:hypothetical protein [Actinomadura fibrosa]|uniref:Uncharacterized protein n=1 Tax=Actinomadura fibrosa TaxID=111802 RepID=A0ABW2XNM7_9ACTN|nr:hypothetical protein [Actinomadura fibrosa]